MPVIIVETFLRWTRWQLAMFVLERLSQSQNISQIKVLSRETTVIVTRKNNYCHNYVIIDEQLSEKWISGGALIVSNIPACHLQLFSTLLHL